MTKRLTWFLSILCLISIASLQALYDQSSSSFHALEKKNFVSFHEPLIPSFPALEALSLGYRSLVADVLWLQTIQYFGAGDPYGNYPALGPVLNRITQLDPKFEYPYEFGLIVLPFMQNGTPAALELGRRAELNLPNNPLTTFYLATVYSLNVKDYKKAAFYYEKAAKIPGAPTAAARLAAISLAHVDGSLQDREVAIAYWQTVESQATSDDEKTRAAQWVTQMQLVYRIEDQSIEYKKQFGHFPTSLQEMVDKHFLDSFPVSPIGRAFDYNSTTGKVSFEKLLNPEN